MTLPANIKRCPGFGDGPEDWLEECETCQRRTDAGGEGFMEPPQVVTLWCEHYIPPDRPEDRRLSELAKQ